MKIIVILILVLAHQNLTAQVFYFATKIGDLGGGSSDAFGINESKQVVGASKTASGQTHAFLWDDGTMTDLTPNETLRTIAFDINNRGQIVGQRGDGSDDQGGVQTAFLLENNSLKNLFGNRSSSRSINDQGNYAITRPGGDVALNYRGINDWGDLVGESLGHGYSPILNGQVLPTSLGRGIAYAINKNRFVVGFSYSDPGNPVAYPTLWTKGTDIVLSDKPGEAFAINNSDQVVGDTGNRAFLWDDGKVLFLDDIVQNATVKFTTARGINDFGDIIAQGNDGQSYFLEASSVPEPTSTLVMSFILLGGATFVAMRRKR